MMSCEQTHLLSPYLDGELSAAEASAFAGHLSACPACSAEADEIRAVSRLIAAARLNLGPSAEETNEVMGRLRLHVQDLVGSADNSLIWMARIFSGVAASILLGGLWMLSSVGSKPPVHVASGGEATTVQVSLTPDPVIDFSSEAGGVSQSAGSAEPTTRESVLARLTGIADAGSVADASATTEDESR